MFASVQRLASHNRLNADRIFARLTRLEPEILSPSMPSRIPPLPHPRAFTRRAARVRFPPLSSLLSEQGFLGRLAGTRRTSSPRPGPARAPRPPAVIGTDAPSGP